MKKEQLISLGLTEEQAEKAEKASMEELKDFVPKTQFDEVSAAKLKIEQEYKTEVEKLKVQMQETQIMSAVKLAVAGSALDTDIVAGLFDKSKLTLSEDGSITGIEEQLKDLKENKSFLFAQKTEIKPQFKGIKPGESKDINYNENQKPTSLSEAVKTYFANNINE